MKYCIFFIILLLCYAGDGAKFTLNLPESIILEESASGNCIASNLVRPPHRIIVTPVNQHSDYCRVDYIKKHHKIKRLNYQQNFTVTCSNGSASSVEIQCFIPGESGVQNIKVKVIEKPKIVEPKIISKSQSITTEVGLPVTLTCYVEGDPNHYWVGWMSRNAIIQKGEEHSISTSPNFKSTNGTIHYLTIHTVKTSGKYHCKVYSISKKVVDQVTHQVLVDNEKQN